jgi:FkbM family methyltransferase
MSAHLRAAFRGVYAALPFKRALYVLLRRRWTPQPGLSRHLYFEGPFEVRVDGVSLRLTNHNSPHETALFGHGLDGWQERVSLRYWIPLCKRASTIADVGANVGIYSLVAKAVNPSATVCAFEPIPRFFQRLVANCAANELDVRTFELALSDQEGEASLWDLPVDHHYHASLSREDVTSLSGLIERRVVTRTLEGLLAAENIDGVDLLKIDVEGWEPEVIKGMGTLLRNRPTMLVEIKSLERATRIEELVVGMGYEFYDIDEDGPPQRQPRLGASRKWNWLICHSEVAAHLGLS